jgi:hypothetical protein
MKLTLDSISIINCKSNDIQKQLYIVPLSSIIKDNVLNKFDLTAKIKPLYSNVQFDYTCIKIFADFHYSTLLLLDYLNNCQPNITGVFLIFSHDDFVSIEQCIDPLKSTKEYTNYTLYEPSYFQQFIDSIKNNPFSFLLFGGIISLLGKKIYDDYNN